MGIGDDMKSLVIGGSSLDTLIRVGEIQEMKKDMTLWADHVTQTVGSTGAGKALCLATLGSEVNFITALGIDQEAEKIRTYFEGENIHLHPVLTDKTSTHTNIMHSEGHRITVFTQEGSTNPQLHGGSTYASVVPL